MAKRTQSKFEVKSTRAKKAQHHNTHSVHDRKPKGNGTTKGAAIEKLLANANGASLAEMTKVTGWQPHSLRGFMSGTLTKRRGLTVISDKINGERRYRIAQAGARS